MGKRSNVLIALGAVVFVLGVVSMLLILGNNDDDGGSSGGDAADRVVEVLVAKEPISAGMLGDDVVTQGLVETVEVTALERDPNAFTSPTQLTGRIAAIEIAPGQQILLSQFTSQASASRAIAVPEGLEGLTIEIPYIQAGARYIGVGDRINVYALMGAGAPPEVRRILAGVEVLDVDRTRATLQASRGANTASPGGTGPVVYLLAVNPVDAERFMFLSTFEGLWLTLASEDQPPAATPGRRYDNVLG